MQLHTLFFELHIFNEFLLNSFSGQSKIPKYITQSKKFENYILF